MNTILSKLPVAIVLVASCAFSASANAQSGSKQALALKLVQIQQKVNSAVMVEQLTGNAVQPLLADWSQRLDESVPPARQKDVRDRLNVELKKFTDATQKAIEDQLAKSAEAALAPIFMDKLTEDEMKTIIAYMESPVSAKFQALGPEAFDAWAKRIVDATQPAVKNSAAAFNDAANRIVNTAVSASPPGNMPSGNAAPRQ